MSMIKVKAREGCSSMEKYVEKYSGFVPDNQFTRRRIDDGDLLIADQDTGEPLLSTPGVDHQSSHFRKNRK